ncbi:hypothetical protein CHH28_12880 [Bacterioplanes sanyensis]|uniref:Uncharacterized protein n=1 Tax=Bacterioplanes sanyensis TaxID=1249553 RepID=A0A222FLG4_9GAMM|nr:hypothetical protein [Bacterioplanes sanyensis]ASP39512.1 hypothetical protein CHH28_12880 [Bacterioplanes sanyensis]
MDKQAFIEQVEQRLLQLFRASKHGVKTPAAERHRLQGFMQAGVFLQLISRDELAQRMERLHQDVFAMSIAERRQRWAEQWPQELLDYSHYDAPAFERYSPAPRRSDGDLADRGTQGVTDER